MSTLTITPATQVRPACPHTPTCPDRFAADAQAARITADHPEQGWALLCNGLVLVDHQPIPEHDHAFPLGEPDADGSGPADCACGMTYQQYDAEMGERIAAGLEAMTRGENR